MDAFEGSKVAAADIDGAFLLVYMKDCVLVKLTGDSLEIMCQLREDYKMQLNKALYGCM